MQYTCKGLIFCVVNNEQWMELVCVTWNIVLGAVQLATTPEWSFDSYLLFMTWHTVIFVWTDRQIRNYWHCLSVTVLILKHIWMVSYCRFVFRSYTVSSIQVQRCWLVELAVVSLTYLRQFYVPDFSQFIFR